MIFKIVYVINDSTIFCNAFWTNKNEVHLL